jgi:site-specific DNA-cytosine methylase
MSCGQIALERAGIPVKTYYASEIDKYAIKVTQANYPNTIQLGDVTKWREWDLPKIDLILAGSPCQGFSFAGKQLAFDDPRSRLFFDFVDIKNYCKPTNFLLENVKMKQMTQQAISDLIGDNPVLINSDLVSAQTRNRNYWTTIPHVTQPKDRGIVLGDIIESGFVDRDKSYCIDANYWKGGNLKSYFDKCRRQQVFEYIGDAKNGKGVYLNPKSSPPCAFYETRTEAGKKARKEMSKALGRDTTPRDAKCKMYLSQPHGKANCIVTVDSFMNYIIDDQWRIRKLTPIECERLQTVPDNYTNHVSNTQRYKMLGNGWTVDVIVHILKNLIHKT